MTNNPAIRGKLLVIFLFVTEGFGGVRHHHTDQQRLGQGMAQYTSVEVAGPPRPEYRRRKCRQRHDDDERAAELLANLQNSALCLARFSPLVTALYCARSWWG